MREKILAHRIRWLIGLCTFLVLFGCSGFPIYNFTTGRQLGSWYFMLMLCIGYFEIGQLLGVLYSRNKVWRSAALALGMTLLGLACRFLLEFGEVSNTCNFTPPQCGAPPLCRCGDHRPGVPVLCGRSAATPGKRLNFPVSPHINF